jgi:hypothetical protein
MSQHERFTYNKMLTETAKAIYKRLTEIENDTHIANQYHKSKCQIMDVLAGCKGVQAESKHVLNIIL